jgi:DNA-directed RNA polymerase sigma subunit (sigma70/sigma32)
MPKTINIDEVPEDELAEAMGVSQPVDPMPSSNLLDKAIALMLSKLTPREQSVLASRFPCPDCASGCCRPRKR